MPTPKRLLTLLDTRDGHVCAHTGYDTGHLVPNHRANRGMGGSKTANRLENLVWVDAQLNFLIEADAEWARLAKARGLKVPRHIDPARVPVFFAAEWQWFRLAGDDRFPIDGPEAMDMMYEVYGDTYTAFGWRT
jgi:hypothetical protein